MADGDDMDQNQQADESNKPSAEVASNEMAVDDILGALLEASLAAEANEVHDVADIDSEFSHLNNVIDELNNYFDRWEERHDQLRIHIREALEEDKKDREQESEAAPSQEETKGQVDDSEADRKEPSETATGANVCVDKDKGSVDTDLLSTQQKNTVDSASSVNSRKCSDGKNEGNISTKCSSVDSEVTSSSNCEEGT